MYKTPIPFAERLRLLWLTFIDKRTPIGAKALVIIGVLYGISPLDFIPDFIPVIGEMDDLAVIIAVILIFLRLTTHIREDLRRTSTYDIEEPTKKPY